VLVFRWERKNNKRVGFVINFSIDKNYDSYQELNKDREYFVDATVAKKSSSF
jgi:hypothetical protein